MMPWMLILYKAISKSSISMLVCLGLASLSMILLAFGVTQISLGVISNSSIQILL